MIQDMAKDVTKRFFGQLWDDFIGYMKIYDFIKLKSAKLTGKSISVPSVDSFWYSILGDRFGGDKQVKHSKLRDGDVLKFKKVFLTEWAPKLPGKAWTIDGIEDFANAQNDSDEILEVNRKFYSILPPESKKRVVAAGYGSIRIARRTRDVDHYMYMSLVGADKWHCDLGIPVVVSKQVYDSYYRYADHGSPWLKEVEGVLHLNEDLPFNQLVPKAIGAMLTPEAESTLRYRSGLPKCYIHIVSPLSIKPTYNDSHPTATAWAQFHSSRRMEPFQYTYVMFNPKKDESIHSAVEFIKGYVSRYQGDEIITDFDGQVPRLEAKFPLNVSTLNSSKFRSQITSLITDYNQWIGDKFRMIEKHW
jgi:hypothetical protein